MKLYLKRAALLLCMLVLALGAASCAKQEKPVTVDLEAQRAVFAQTAKNRLIEAAEGVVTENILETQGNALISVDYPLVEGNETISAEIKTFANKQVEDFRAEMGVVAPSDEMTGLYNMVLTYKPYMVGQGGLLGVKFTESAYTGKTDRKNYIDAFVYDLQTGGRLGLDDVFDPAQNYLTAISETAREYLLRNEILQKNMDEDLFEAGTAPNAQNFSNFVIMPDNKILFFFNKNTVAPGAAGTIEVCVPLMDLDAVLNPQNKDLLYGKAKPAPPASELPALTLSGEVTSPVEAGTIAQLALEGNFMPPGSLEGIDPLNDKVIALTFDDGPNPAKTPELLDVLKENDVTATFFMVGNLMEQYPGVAKRAYAEGHEIGTHSWDHPTGTWTSLSTEERAAQYNKANDTLEKLVGKRTLIDRPVGGGMSEEMARQIGREQIIWSVDPHDWEYKDVDVVYNNVIGSGELRDGAVILAHDIYQTTVDAFRRIIPELKNQGYQFVTVTQMMQIAQLRGKTLDYLFLSAPAA